VAEPVALGVGVVDAALIVVRLTVGYALSDACFSIELEDGRGGNEGDEEEGCEQLEELGCYYGDGIRLVMRYLVDRRGV
jgi:hypothetical protein